MLQSKTITLTENDEFTTDSPVRIVVKAIGKNGRRVRLQVIAMQPQKESQVDEKLERPQ